MYGAFYLPLACLRLRHDIGPWLDAGCWEIRGSSTFQSCYNHKHCPVLFPGVVWNETHVKYTKLYRGLWYHIHRLNSRGINKGISESYEIPCSGLASENPTSRRRAQQTGPWTSPSLYISTCPSWCWSHQLLVIQVIPYNYWKNISAVPHTPEFY